MKRFLQVSLLAIACGLASCSPASGGGAPGGSAGAGFSCSLNIAGTQQCYGYTNLTPAQASAERNACTAQSGRLTGSCPTGAVGCCTTTTAGYTLRQCYYSGMAGQLQAECAGTWSGGDGSGGGTGSGGTSPGGSGGSGYGAGGTGVAGSGGSQGCPASQVQCPKGCVDLQKDVNNCGSCGYACPAGPAGTTPICSGASCTYVCNNTSERYCKNAGGCVDTQTDVNNCGSCGVRCQDKLIADALDWSATGLVCAGGSCEYDFTNGEIDRDCASASCNVTCDQICQADHGLSCTDAPNTFIDCDRQSGGTCAAYNSGTGDYCGIASTCGTKPATSYGCLDGPPVPLSVIECSCHGTVHL